MMRTLGSKFSLVLLVLLGLSEDVLWASSHAPSLCYNFTITTQGPQWCYVQGQVNGTTFLHYNCGQEGEPIGPLGMEVHNPDVWKDQIETLREKVEELKKKLLDIKPQISSSSNPLSLQGKMMCQLEASGRTRGSWEFRFNESKCLLFDSEQRNWTALCSQGIFLNETLHSDKALINFLVRISTTDCERWYKNIRKSPDNVLNTTAPTVKASVTAQSNAIAIRPTAWNLIVVLTCFILTGFLG